MSHTPKLRLSESDEESNLNEHVQKVQIFDAVKTVNAAEMVPKRRKSSDDSTSGSGSSSSSSSSDSSSSSSSGSSDSSSDEEDNITRGNKPSDLVMVEHDIGGTLNEDATRNLDVADAGITAKRWDEGSPLLQEQLSEMQDEIVNDNVDVASIDALGGFTENALSTSVDCPNLSKVWSQATVLQPYAGELMPKRLHCTGSFSSAFANLGEQPPLTQASKLMNMFYPKFKELMESRRFRADTLTSYGASLIAKSSTWELHRKCYKQTTDVVVKLFTDYNNAVDIVKEVHTLLHLQHKRVTQLLGAFHDVQTHLIMPLMQGVLAQNISFLIPIQKYKFIMQLLQAVSFIHDKDILHLDITPSNVFITSDNNAVLGNFGYSQVLPKGVKYVRADADNRPIGSPSYSDAFANSRVYSKASDIFGLGCTMYEIDTNKPLMEYRSWNAPVEEYIKVATLGRLRRFPPPRDPHPCSSQQRSTENVTGDREPLKERVNASMFASFLWDMVKHSLTKPAAEEIFQNQKNFFSNLLNQQDIDLDDLENYTECVFVQLVPKNSPQLVPPKLSSKLNFALDAIYFDSELPKDYECSNPKDEAEESQRKAVSVNLLKTAIEELIERKGRDVKKSGTPANLSKSTMKFEASVADALAIAAPIRPVSSEFLHGELISTVEMCSKNLTQCDKPPNTVKKHFGDAPKQATSKVQFKPFMPSLPTSSATGQPMNILKLATKTTSHDTSARSSFQTSSSKSSESKAAPANPKDFTSLSVSKLNRNEKITEDRGSAFNESSIVDDARATQKPRKKRKYLYGAITSQKEQHLTEDISDGKRPKNSADSRNRKDESPNADADSEYESDPDLWVSIGTGDVPADKRGRPAPFTNIPDDVRKAQNLKDGQRGWLDCPVCSRAWFTDYLEWVNHVNECEPK